MEYACEDADITFRLYECFAPIIKKLELDKLFFNIEMPLIEVLADMEFDGVYISSKKMEKQSEAVL